jgi:hypothetical protein
MDDELQTRSTQSMDYGLWTADSNQHEAGDISMGSHQRNGSFEVPLLLSKTTRPKKSRHTSTVWLHC